MVVDLKFLVADSGEQGDGIRLACEDDEEGEHGESEPAAASGQGRARAVGKVWPVVRLGTERDA